MLDLLQVIVHQPNSIRKHGEESQSANQKCYLISENLFWKMCFKIFLFQFVPSVLCMCFQCPVSVVPEYPIPECPNVEYQILKYMYLAHPNPDSPTRRRTILNYSIHHWGSRIRHM